MRGNAGFGNPIHFPGPDLDFNALAKRADDRGMQGLIHIGFGTRNIILEFVIDRLPHGMNQPQGFIAMGDGIKDNPESNDIVYFFERQVLGYHFIVDAEVILVTAQHLTGQLGFVHLFLNVVFDGLHIFFALGFGLGHEGLNLAVFIRLHIFKR